MTIGEFKELLRERNIHDTADLYILSAESCILNSPESVNKTVCETPDGVKEFVVCSSTKDAYNAIIALRQKVREESVHEKS